jgi:hypothetical protein
VTEPPSKSWRRFALRPELWAAVAYLVLALLLLKYFWYSIGKDNISYMSIAEKYAVGDFRNAINGYWAPLISWLLSGILLLGFSPLAGTKLLSLLIGLFACFSFGVLSRRFVSNERLRACLLALVVVSVLYHSLHRLSPDLLLAGILSLYFAVVFSPDYGRSKSAGWLCGIIGALAYFAKNYAFAFFVAHFFICSLIHYLSNSDAVIRKVVLRNFITGLAVFFVISAGWVGLLHQKYGLFTVGIAGSYNHAAIGPDTPGGPDVPGGVPTAYFGFVPPPNATATSVWEDPSYFLTPLKSWSPLSSTRALWHQLSIIKRSTLHTIEIFQTFSVFALAIILTSLLLSIERRSPFQSRLLVIFALVTMALYSAGYLPLFAFDRYLIPVQFLLILLGGYLAERLRRSGFFSSGLGPGVMLAALGISFLVYPIKELRLNAHKGRAAYEFSRLLANDGLAGVRLASNDNFNEGLIIAYFLKAKYYGQAKKNQPLQETVEDLRTNSITHYLVFDKPPMDLPGLQKSKDLNLKPIRGARMRESRESRELVLYSVLPKESSP